MFDYLKYKLTGRPPYYSRLVGIAKRYGWLEPEVAPAAASYIVALVYDTTVLRAFWNYRKDSWLIRMGESEVDRGAGFDTFVQALKSWQKTGRSQHNNPNNPMRGES